jgi:hypothetical protein
LPTTGINTISSIFNATLGYIYSIVGDKVLLTDTSTTNNNIEFSYVLKNSLRSDSSTASVSILKDDILTKVFPGDMNSDSLVNHLDLLSKKMDIWYINQLKNKLWQRDYLKH